MKYKILSALILSIPTQAFSYCLPSEHDGRWYKEKDDSYLEIISECKESEEGVDFMKITVTHSLYGVANSVFEKKDGSIRAIYEDAVQTIKIENSHSISVKTKEIYTTLLP